MAARVLLGGENAGRRNEWAAQKKGIFSGSCRDGHRRTRPRRERAEQARLPRHDRRPVGQEVSGTAAAAAAAGGGGTLWLGCLFFLRRRFKKIVNGNRAATPRADIGGAPRLRGERVDAGSVRGAGSREARRRLRDATSPLSVTFRYQFYFSKNRV